MGLGVSDRINVDFVGDRGLGGNVWGSRCCAFDSFAGLAVVGAEKIMIFHGFGRAWVEQMLIFHRFGRPWA